VLRPVPVDERDGLVTHYPGVMTGREVCHGAGSDFELLPVLHLDVQRPGGVVLEVGRLAPPRAGDRLDVDRPTPPRVQHEPADYAAIHVQDLRLTMVEASDLIRSSEVPVLGLCHALHTPSGLRSFTAGEFAAMMRVEPKERNARLWRQGAAPSSRRP